MFDFGIAGPLAYFTLKGDHFLNDVSYFIKKFNSVVLLFKGISCFKLKTDILDLLLSNECGKLRGFWCLSLDIGLGHSDIEMFESEV